MNVFTNYWKPLGGFEGVFVLSFNFKNNFFFPVRFVFNKNDVFF
jgi:hypothetical protein